MSNFAQYPSLKDRVVLVTGGGSGIGASIVEEFALQGSRVAFFDIAEEASRQLVESVAPKCVHRPLFIPCNVTDIPALRAAIARVAAECGSPAVLVNNAASDERHEFADVTPEYWDERIGVNLKQQYFAAQAVAALMKEAGGGSIINMSSTCWMIPSPKMSVYLTAKSAIVGMTRSMARELGKFNIRANCVLPGSIFTERQRRLWWSPEYEAEVLEGQCVKRLLTPEDIARVILFLAADDSGSITSQSHIADGGWM